MANSDKWYVLQFKDLTVSLAFFIYIFPHTPINPHDNDLTLSPVQGQLFFSLRLAQSKPWQGLPRKDWTDSYVRSKQSSRAPRSLQMPSPRTRQAALVMPFSHVEHWDAPGASFSRGHVWDSAFSSWTTISSWSVSQLSAGSSGSYLPVENKICILQAQELLTEMFMDELDGSDEWSQWSSC